MTPSQGRISADGCSRRRGGLAASTRSARRWSGSMALRCCATTAPGGRGSGSLEQQFIDRLISEPGAFVVTADGRDAFAQAVRRKLVLEIAGLTGGSLLAEG